ncbi:hypothetical protein C8R43DRAFT_963432 [Mycena crocata]|nr:hypothetical protein C8R43DRAFT_963432 [Mycena crocata]
MDAPSVSGVSLESFHRRVQELLQDLDGISAWFVSRPTSCDLKSGYLFELTRAEHYSERVQFDRALESMQSRRSNSVLSMPSPSLVLVEANADVKPAIDPAPAYNYDERLPHYTTPHLHLQVMDRSHLLDLVIVQQDKLALHSDIFRHTFGNAGVTDPRMVPELVFAASHKAHYCLMEVLFTLKCLRMTTDGDPDTLLDEFIPMFEDALTAFVEDLDAWTRLLMSNVPRARNVTCFVIIEQFDCVIFIIQFRLNTFCVDCLVIYAPIRKELSQINRHLRSVVHNSPELWDCFYVAPSQDVDNMVEILGRAQSLPLTLMVVLTPGLVAVAPPTSPRPGPVSSPMVLVSALVPFLARCEILVLNAWDVAAMNTIHTYSHVIDTTVLRSLSVERYYTGISLYGSTAVTHADIFGPLPMLSYFLPAHFPEWTFLLELLVNAPRLARLAVSRLAILAIPSGRLIKTTLPSITHVDVGLDSTPSLAVFFAHLNLRALIEAQATICSVEDLAALSVCSAVFAPVRKFVMKGFAADVQLISDIVRHLDNLRELDVTDAGEVLVAALDMASVQLSRVARETVIAAPMLTVLRVGRADPARIYAYVRSRAETTATLTTVAFWADPLHFSLDVHFVDLICNFAVVVDARPVNSARWRRHELDYSY